MHRKVNEMRDRATELVSQLPAEELAHRTAEIARILRDYDFAIDIEDIAINNPVHILLDHLESFMATEKSDRLEAEWFAALTLFLVSHLQEHDSNESYYHFIWHAFNTAVVSDERAKIIRYRRELATS